MVLVHGSSFRKILAPSHQILIDIGIAPPISSNYSWFGIDQATVSLANSVNTPTNLPTSKERSLQKSNAGPHVFSLWNY